MHVNTVRTAALAKITKPAVVHPGKMLPGKLLFVIEYIRRNMRTLKIDGCKDRAQK